MIREYNLQTGEWDFDNFEAIEKNYMEWIAGEQGECQMDVSENSRMIILEYIHYNDSDGASTCAVIMKDEVDNPTDLYNKLVELSKKEWDGTPAEDDDEDEDE